MGQLKFQVDEKRKALSFNDANRSAHMSCK